jgi:hypothetical protein
LSSHLALRLDCIGYSDTTNQYVSCDFQPNPVGNLIIWKPSFDISCRYIISSNIQLVLLCHLHKRNSMESSVLALTDKHLCFHSDSHTGRLYNLENSIWHQPWYHNFTDLNPCTWPDSERQIWRAANHLWNLVVLNVQSWHANLVYKSQDYQDNPHHKSTSVYSDCWYQRTNAWNFILGRTHPELR